MEYHLIGLIGKEPHPASTHYYSILRQQNEWLLMNDQQVRRESFGRINQHHMFYDVLPCMNYYTQMAKGRILLDSILWAYMPFMLVLPCYTYYMAVSKK